MPGWEIPEEGFCVSLVGGLGRRGRRETDEGNGGGRNKESDPQLRPERGWVGGMGWEGEGMRVREDG